MLHGRQVCTYFISHSDIFSVGVSEWIRLDGNPNIAKFGSKTGIYGEDSPKVDSTSAPVPEATTTDDITGLNVEEDYRWRTNLGVGDIIDAKDKTGTWYQVNTIETHVTIIRPAFLSWPMLRVRPIQQDLRKRKITTLKKKVIWTL